MKRYIYASLIVFALFLSFNIKSVYAADEGSINAYIKDDIIEEYIPKDSEGNWSIEFLREYFEWIGDPGEAVDFPSEPEKLTVKLKITKIKKGKKMYYQIGEDEGVYKALIWPEAITNSNINDNGFLDNKNNKEGSSWYIWIDMLFSEEKDKRVYFVNTFADSEDIDPIKMAWAGLRQDWEDKQDEEDDEELKQKFTDIITHPIQALIWALGELFRSIGDVFQKIADSVILDNGKLSYTYKKLESTPELDAYTKVGKYSTTKKEGTINLKKNGSSDAIEKRFSKSTKIPLIKVDIYNLAAGTINIFDVNFLKVDKIIHNGTGKDAIWQNIRNVIAGIIHGVMYIVAALLVVLLIWNAVKIIASINETPEKQKKSKEALNKFTTSFIMLVGSILIMAICIYASNIFFDSVKTESKIELPIRVNSAEAEYSFSTNFTGYLKYMASIEGIGRCLEKTAFAVAYMVVAFFNAVIAIIMFVRMIMMMILAIVGPVLAGLNAFNINVKMKYSTWIITYVLLSSIQLLFAIMYKIIYAMV